MLHSVRSGIAAATCASLKTLAQRLSVTTVCVELEILVFTNLPVTLREAFSLKKLLEVDSLGLEGPF